MKDFITRRNIGIDIEIYFTFVNVRLLLLFLCNLGSIHGHFIRFCGSLLVRCCFPKLCEGRQVTVCILNWQISPASKNRTPIRHESAESLRPGKSLIISPHRGYCDVFFFVCEKSLKVFASGQSDVRSGNSTTTSCVMIANILNTLIHVDNSKQRSRPISRLSEGRKIHALSYNFDYPDTLSPCWRSPLNA